MSDEKPVSLLKRSASQLLASSGVVCIVHYDRCLDVEVRPLSDSQFSTITAAAKIRQLQTSLGVRLDSICNAIPSQFDSNCHGAHAWCYKNFTNVSRLRENVQTDDTLHTDVLKRTSSRVSTTPSSSTKPLFPQNRCIFCDKEFVYKQRKREFLLTCVTSAAEETIKQRALEKNDFKLLGVISDQDLRAREARYHESCRKWYVRQDSKLRYPKKTAAEDDDNEDYPGMIAAHAEVFTLLCQHITDNLIRGGRVERMTMLRSRYLQMMEDLYPDFYNPNYTAQKLKNKLLKQYGTSLQFWLPHAACKSELVFSSHIDLGEAVEVAFDACSSETAVLDKAASILSAHITSSFRQAPKLPWPPSPSDVQTVSPPSILLEFVGKVIGGRSSRKDVVAQSISQDLCYAVTGGRWVMPKQVMLGMSVRHLTGSAELVTLLNRYGHCQYYTKVMELETAMAYSVQKKDSVLPSNISVFGNDVCHTCWDNFDLNEETASGSDTTHSTHGIVVQEVLPSAFLLNPEHTAANPTSGVKSRSFRYEEQPLTPVCLRSKTEPVIDVHSALTADSSSLALYSARGLLWILCRSLCNEAMTVPEWSGWLSLTADNEAIIVRSSIGYLTPVMQPITQHETVLHCLRTSVEVSAKLGQDYTFVTFDLAAAKLAFNTIWNFPDEFKNVQVHLGAFHTMCSYLGSLGKMMAGSGLEDIVIESGICASGSLAQVMNGKHFNRSMHVHQVILMALDHMLIRLFTEQSPIANDCMAEIEQLGQKPGPEAFAVASEGAHFNELTSSFLAFIDSVRNGAFGLTAKLWMSYHDAVWTLLTFLQAVKENNVSLYIQSLRQMCSLLFAADHLNYARYLPLYIHQLANLRHNNPAAYVLLERNGLSVSRSDVPACRNAVDLTIEQTINRSAKTPGGIVGFSRSPGAYYRWCLTRHKRAMFLEAALDCVQVKATSSDAHASTRAADMRHSATDVQRVIEAFHNFISPFDECCTSNEVLYCISSGQQANTEVCRDMLAYVDRGEQEAAKFIQERLVQKTVKFHDVLKKQRLHTFAAQAAVRKVTTVKQKTLTIKAERNLLGKLLVLGQSHDLCLDKIFTYPLAAIPWSLATADGCLCKTNKAQLLHVIEKDVMTETAEVVPSHTIVVDGNALFHAVVKLPRTFGEFARTVFNHLPKSVPVHFVTDSYHTQSIKEGERRRRGSAGTHVIGGGQTKLPSDFKKFLHSSENKKQLISFILREWQQAAYAADLQCRDVYYVCEENCCLLTSVDGKTVSCETVPQLASNHEEADTRIILHCVYAAQTSSAVTVRSPDTDVLVLLVAKCRLVSAALLFETGTGNNRRILNVHRIADSLGEDVCTALPGLHAFTGCDSTSAFVRKGKKGPYKLMKNSPVYVNTFAQLGAVAVNVSPEVLTNLEKFVCAMYGWSSQSSVNKVRAAMFQARYGVKTARSLSATSSGGTDLSLLPPCRRSLVKHCLRANFQAYIWRQSNVNFTHLPSPSTCGWTVEDDGIMDIDWFDGDAIPDSLCDILADSGDKSDDDVEAEFLDEHEDDLVDNIIDAVFEDEDEEQFD